MGAMDIVGPCQVNNKAMLILELSPTKSADNHLKHEAQFCGNSPKGTKTLGAFLHKYALSRSFARQTRGRVRVRKT